MQAKRRSLNSKKRVPNLGSTDSTTNGLNPVNHVTCTCNCYSVFERSVERFAVLENASKYEVRASVLIQSNRQGSRSVEAPGLPRRRDANATTRRSVLCE